MYDAMGVRREAGRQARILNRMVDFVERGGPDISDRELKEIIGHTPLEVLAGMLLGFLVALALY
jgi:acid phosphatase family membrane protein YuiD